MSEAEARFTILRQSADPDAAAALERLVRSGTDRVLNDRLDYFGQTVNIAARVQGLALSQSIFATEPVVSHPDAMRLLDAAGLTPTAQRTTLRGISDELTVYEIP